MTLDALSADAALAGLLADCGAAAPAPGGAGSVRHHVRPPVRLPLSLATRCARPASNAALQAAGLPAHRVIHAGQTVRWTDRTAAAAPLTASGRLTGRPRQIRAGSLAVVSVAIHRSGRPDALPVARVDSRALVIDPAASAETGAAGARMDEEPPDAARTTGVRLSREHLARFAEISGDGHPAHLDPAAARSLGFPDVVAHGALLLAIAEAAAEDACRALETYAAMAPVAARVRFTAPVVVPVETPVEVSVILGPVEAGGPEGEPVMAVELRAAQRTVLRGAVVLGE